MKTTMMKLRRATRVQAAILAALIPALAIMPTAVRANPSGGTVAHGDVLIDDISVPGHLMIHQGSDKAIINWQDFSIAAGETTQFLQPSAAAVALNRVISGNPSNIFGTLSANGGVILVNPNGILVGAGGVVDVGGLMVMSTLNVDDADFLDGGTMRFFGDSPAAVTNLGTITSRGGDVVLLANMVVNEGAVGAPDGTVAFGAGGEFIVDTIGDSRISVIGAGPGGDTGIKNSGTVSASNVEFKAHGNVYALAIQNTGVVRAGGVNRSGGRIVLSAAGDGTVGGKIENSGTLRARTSTGAGGNILIDGGVGGQVDITGDGRVDANGDKGQNGGTVMVLGDIVNVTDNARVSADGDNGGFVQLGSPESTSVTVGGNARVSANGSVGNGGAVMLLANPGSGSVNVTGTAQVTANGAVTGGVVSMQAANVTTGLGTTVSANGGQNGGIVTAVGQNVNLGGAVSATGGTGTGGFITVNGQRISTGTGSSVDVSGGTVGGTAALDATNTVNVEGAVNANSVNGGGGTIMLRGNGGVNVGEEGAIRTDGASGGKVNLDSSGETNVNGELSATGLSGLGGRVNVAGDRVVIGGNSVIDASGAKGGGNVNIGGGYQGGDARVRNSTSTIVQDGARVKVDAFESGNGGNAVVWSNGSTFYRGDISAQAHGATGNGGFIEISGKQELSITGTASTKSANGRNGVLLIDPVNVLIGAANSGTIGDATLVAMLANSHVIVHTAGVGVDAGDITIGAGADVVYDSPNSVTFLAHNNIIVNGDVKNHGLTDASGTGHINLVAGWDGTLPGTVGATAPANAQSVSDPGVVSAADFIAADGTPIVGRFGSWGTPGSRILFNDANVEPVEVGSARGETNVFGETILLKSGDTAGEFSQIGYRRVADNRDVTMFGAAAGTAAANAIAASQIVDGNINVSAKSALLMIVDPGVSATLGAQNVNLIYTQIGHGGYRSNSDVYDNRANSGVYAGNFGSDSGITAVGQGDASGDITVNAGFVLYMQGDDSAAYTKIGHGGYGQASMNSNTANLTFVAPVIAGASIGNDDIVGNMTGDINVTAGVISVEAGLRSDVWAQIGHGGVRVRGEHGGDINLTSTLGDITGSAAPNLEHQGTATNANDGIWTNNRDRSYVHFGHGGFDSDHLLASPAVNPDGTSRVVTLNTPDPDGGGALLAGANDIANTSVVGDGISINPATGLPYGHWGNITVNSAGALRMTASGAEAWAMLGHGGRSTMGDHRGDITVTTGTDLTFDRIVAQVDDIGNDRSAAGAAAFVQLGHGGYIYNGGATGDINLNIGGDVTFLAGRNEAYAMIGHGGRGENGNVSNGQRNSGWANGTHSGDINLTAGGDVTFRSGFGNASLAWSQIGHGGFFQHADVIENDQWVAISTVATTSGPHTGDPAGTVYTNSYIPPAVGFNPVTGLPVINGAPPVFGLVGGGASSTQELGHHGDIVINAGGDVSFIAGPTFAISGQEEWGVETNGRNSYTMIGHGGFQSWGDHWGNIDVTSGGNLELEGRGGYQAVSIEGGNGGLNTPGAFAGSDGNANGNEGTPRLAGDEDNNRAGFRNFAMMGHGGLDSEHRLPSSTQNFNATGALPTGMGVWGPSDITVNVGGDVTVKAAQKEDAGHLLPKLATRTFVAGLPVYTDALGTVVNYASGDYNINYGRLDIVVRANGDRWLMPDPVFASRESSAQIGHGGLGTDVLDAAGNNGNTRINNPGGQNANLTTQGLGHRGNITINAGGGVTVLGSDFKGEVSGITQNNSNTQQNPPGQTLSILVDGNGAAGIAPDGVFDQTPIRVGPGTPTTELVAVAGLPLGSNGTSTSPRSQRDISDRGGNYAQIGLGGRNSRGDHQGDITINAGQNASGVGVLVQGGEGREDYAQIGNGGYDADRNNDDNRRLNDVGLTGNISVIAVGDISVLGGGIKGDVTGAFGDATTLAANILENDDNHSDYAVIGHGGFATGGSHIGNITVQSTGGDVSVIAGNAQRRALAQIGNGGHSARAGGSGAVGTGHGGDITVIANGNVTVQGGKTILDTVDPVVAGVSTVANLGQISVGRENYATIGNGGFDSDPQGTSLNWAAGTGGHSGNIEVVAVNGSVILNGGSDPTLSQNDDRFRAMSAVIGNGGDFTDGDHLGDIRVSAGTNVELYGGGGRDAYAGIGHVFVGENISGNLSGTIEVIAGEDLIMARGADTTTQSAASGTQIFNNFVKIGHGDHTRTGTPNRNSGTGTRNGDIFVSVGNDVLLSDPANRPFADVHYTRPNPDQTFIGHIDALNQATAASRAALGDTFIGASRNDPFFDTGTGRMFIGADAVLTSAFGGLLSELRLYVPNPTLNEIQTGAFLNNKDYTRIPTPDGTRADEEPGTDHTQTLGVYSEPDGVFVPEGFYTPSGFGFYTVYYSDENSPVVVPPVVPPVVDLGGGGFFVPQVKAPELAPIVIPPFDFSPFFGADKFDSFDRYGAGPSAFFGRLFSIFGLDANRQYEASLDDGIYVEGEEILDEPKGLFGLGPAQTEAEEEEEEEKSGRYLRTDNSFGIYYTYDPSTTEYSSLRQFSLPEDRFERSGGNDLYEPRGVPDWYFEEILDSLRPRAGARP